MKIVAVFALFVIFLLLISGCISFSKDTPPQTIKSDFGQDSQDKIAMRVLATPIVDTSTFNLIVQSVITDNPFRCVGYTSDGTHHDPIEKIKEVYTTRILYKDNTSKETFTSYAEYQSAAAAILPMIHDSKNDTFGATLKCHDVNGEIYYVVFTRNDVTLAAYSDDSIRIRFETWANTVASLMPAKEKTKQKNSEYMEGMPFL